MTDIITIHTATSGPYTETGDSLPLTIDSDGNCFYTTGGSSYEVVLIQADLDSPSLTVTIAPHQTSGRAYVYAVSGERQGNDHVTGGVTWAYDSNDMVLTFTTPGTSDHSVDWVFTNGSVPAIKLNVRIVRN